jgi:hypothetical protein
MALLAIALREPGIVASHAVFGFEMTDHGLDGGPCGAITA